MNKDKRQIIKYVASNGMTLETSDILTREEVEREAREVLADMNKPVPAALLTRNWLNKTKDPVGFVIDDEGED